MQEESRLSVAQHVLKGGALAGDEVAVKVVLDPEIFRESLLNGHVELVLTHKGDFICPKTILSGVELVRVVNYSTCAASKFDVTVRFALLELGEPVLFSAPFLLGAPPTPEEIALAMKELMLEKSKKLPANEPERKSASSPRNKSPTSSPRSKSPTSSPRGTANLGKEAPKESSTWVRARSGSGSPRAPSPRVRSISSADQVPSGRPSSFRSRLGKPLVAGQVVSALCAMDDEWRKATIRVVGDDSVTVWFDDIALEQETPLENLQLLKTQLDEEQPKSKGVGFARVSRDFVALRDGQLSVKKASVVDVLSIPNKDWMIVSNQAGDKGMVPQNCLIYPAQ